jgi:hypothetical protein
VGGGGFITGLSLDPGGKTFVTRTDVYGAYIWSPKADRWVQLVNADAMPQNDRVQAGLAAGVYEVVVALRGRIASIWRSRARSIAPMIGGRIGFWPAGAILSR